MKPISQRMGNQTVADLEQATVMIPRRNAGNHGCIFYLNYEKCHPCERKFRCEYAQSSGLPYPDLDCVPGTPVRDEGSMGSDNMNLKPSWGVSAMKFDAVLNEDENYINKSIECLHYNERQEVVIVTCLCMDESMRVPGLKMKPIRTGTGRTSVDGGTGSARLAGRAYVSGSPEFRRRTLGGYMYDRSNGFGRSSGTRGAEQRSGDHDLHKLAEWWNMTSGWMSCPSFSLFLQSIRLGSCLLYTSPSPRDRQKSRMPSSA